MANTIKWMCLLLTGRRGWRWPEPDLRRCFRGRRRPGGGIREEPWRTESDGEYFPAGNLWPILSSQTPVKLRRKKKNELVDGGDILRAINLTLDD